MGPHFEMLLPTLTLLITSKFASGKILLHSTQGVVPRENFTYFSLNYNGNIILELKTKYGDADLYVSEKHLKPGYEPDRYDLHSATCGPDIVYIPKSYVRPIGVGIYGHSAHDFSTYILEVYVATANDGLAEDFEDVERRYESARTPAVVTTAPQQEQPAERAKPAERKANAKIKKVLTKSGLWALLEMFEMIFL